MAWSRSAAAIADRFGAIRGITAWPTRAVIVAVAEPRRALWRRVLHSRTRRRSLGLVDIPEDRRCRAVEHAAERFPRHDGREILPERDVDHLVVDFLLDLGGDLLLLLG